MEAEVAALRQAGYDVALFATRTDELEGDRLYRVRAAMRVVTGRGANPLDALRKFDPDLVHVHNLFPNFGRRWVEEVQVPLVHTLHNFRPLCANGLLLRDGAVCTRCPSGDRWAGLRFGCYRDSRLATLPLTVANRRGPMADPLIRRADRLIVLSDRQRQVYEDAGVPPERMVLSPNFLPDELEPGWSNAPRQGGWLFVGRLSEEKGILRLLETWPPGESLTIVGDGPQREAVELLGSRVGAEIMGKISRSAVVEIMRRRAGLVFPSICYEGFPLVYAEALAVGLPVVAFEPSAVASAVAHDRTGVVADWEREGVESALREISSGGDPLRAHCRQVFEALYSQQRFCDRVSVLYGSLVAERKPKRPPEEYLLGPEMSANRSTAHLDAAPESERGGATKPESAGNYSSLVAGHAPEVVVVQKALPHYRVDLFEQLRDRLEAHGVQMRLLTDPADPTAVARREVVRVTPWSEIVRNRSWRIGGRQLIWQPVLRKVRSADLVIVEQASKLLVNYPLLAWSRLGGPKVAYWGHGANLNKEEASSIGEALKSKLILEADWWFCYTDGTADLIRNYGVPLDRMTVVQNAVDTNRVREMRSVITDKDLVEERRSLGIGAGPVAVSIGSLYDAKRPEFLLAAADHLRGMTPGFELIVIGDGPSRDLLDTAARKRPWLHVLGALHGQELVRAASLACLLLNPGLVGLPILDAFSLGLPIVTCELPCHSPEIEYLKPGVNGLILPNATRPYQYAMEVSTLLQDPERLRRLAAGAQESGHRYTLEEMVDRFAAGILAALGRLP